MKIAFLVRDLGVVSDSNRSTVLVANRLAAQHEVEMLQVYGQPQRRGRARQPSPVPGIRQTTLLQRRGRGVDVRARPIDGAPGDHQAERLHAEPSLLAPDTLAGGFSALTDVLLQQALQRSEADAVVAIDEPVLLHAATRFAPTTSAVIYQEHQASRPDGGRLDALSEMAPLADAVTVLNPTEARWLRDRLTAGSPPVSSIPHVLPQRFRPRSHASAPLILTVAPLTGDRQHADLVRAFSSIADQLPRWRVRIVGKGPRRTALESLVRRYKLFDRVEIVSPPADIAGEWAQAGIGVSTARSDGMPTSVLEGMWAGVPMVSYDSPTGPRHLITHGQDGLLVAPGSVAGLASALLQLALEQQLREKLAAAAIESSQRYCPSKVFDAWDLVLEDAVARARTRGGVSRHVYRAHEAAAVEAPAPTPATSSGGYPGAESAWTHTSPADARSAALRHAAELAQQTSRDWFAVPPTDTREAPVLAIPSPSRTQFLRRLCEQPGARDVFVRVEGAHGWPALDGVAADLARRLDNRQPVRLELQLAPREGLHAHGCAVAVEFWEPVHDALVAPRPNMFATRVPLDEPRVTASLDGVEVPTLALMAGPTVFTRPFEVDMVYTWVDGSDQEWARRREQRLREVRGLTYRIEAVGAGRYTSRDELRYSLRSAHLFAPWVRHIYLVTDRQVPEWLDTQHPSISVVDHRDILDATCLPTFNSHAIETGLHHIDGLSEQFIYMNDDVFLGRPTGKADFFSPAGQPAAFFSTVEVGLDDPTRKPHLVAGFNNRTLLRRDFGRNLTLTLAHTPHPQSRSLLYELEERYSDDFSRTAAAPFRSPDDIAAVASLSQHYSLLTGRGVVGALSSTFVSLNRVDLAEALNRLLAHRNDDTFCISDYHEYVLSAGTVDRLVDDFLRAYYPVTAPWELNDA